MAYPDPMIEMPGDELMRHHYSAEFENDLEQFLSTRGGSGKWSTLHGNGPNSRMAGFESATLAELEHHTGSLAGKRVLDFGCGTGTITPSLARRAREVVAFDVSADAVEITRARLREYGIDGVDVHCADSYCEVAAELGKFDLVMMHAVFEHVPLSIDGLRPDVMQLAFDALAPGGHLFISESPNRLYPRDIYCTGLWLIPWTRGGSRWSYRRAIKAGRHVDPNDRGSVSLEERGAWGFTYWSVKRYLRERSYEVVNTRPGHDRWVRYGRTLSRQRRWFETGVHHTATRFLKIPIVALTPMLSPLVLERTDAGAETD